MSDWEFLNKRRIKWGDYRSTPEDGWNGAFAFSIPGEARLVFCVCSDGMGWKHVSVSFGIGSKKTPSWELMCKIKELFFEPDDWVIQFHPPSKDNINIHPGCLHLWKCIDGREQPIPDKSMV